MAENKNENQQSQEMLDKTYVVEGFDPSKLQNADVNLSQYWDDSSEANYNNPSLWGGENTKYTGENTLGSQVAYNPNATVEGLDPNYLYWQEAQMQNSKEANYIAKRNDEIASALYNAWKTSIQDVNDFLDSQRGFYNSVWNERANTVTAVWKRIGQIAKQNEKSDEPQADPNKTPDEWNNDALNNMQSDLNKSTAWELYGKVTADQSTHINTLEDENSVYKSMNESRLNAFKQLQGMSDESIAATLVAWLTASDSQAMRDLMQYDPAKYEAVKLAEKKLRGQMNINSITSGEWDFVTTATNGKSGVNNGIADFANNNSNWVTSTADILKGINQTLSSNVSASSASETMDAIENDMAVLQNRLKNLKREANTVFKWDVPQYIVNAYVANRTAEIQDQLSILENRYNAASSRYQEEVKNTQRQMEYELKKEELQIKKDAADLDDWATRQGIALKWYEATKWSSTTSTNVDGNKIQVSNLTREEIGTSIDELVTACQNWQLWNAQCAAGIQKYYLPILGVDLWTLSKWSEKQWICNRMYGEYTPQKWDLVIMSSKSKPENWHIAMVISVDGDNMTYLDWNGTLWADGNGNEEPQIRTKKMSAMWIYGYYDPTKRDGQEWRTYNWNEDDYTDYYRMTDKEFWALSNDYRNQILWHFWNVETGEALDNFRYKKRLYNNEVVKAEWTKQGLEVLRSIAQLYNSIWNEDGKLNINWMNPDTTWKDKFDQIVEQLKLEKLLEARANGATFGSMTEWEWKIIQDAASSLHWYRLWSTTNKEMERVIAAVWHATYWSKMTKDDWNAFKTSVWEADNWNNGWETEDDIENTAKLDQIWGASTGTNLGQIGDMWGSWMDFWTIVMTGQ